MIDTLICSNVKSIQCAIMNGEKRVQSKKGCFRFSEFVGLPISDNMLFIVFSSPVHNKSVYLKFEVCYGPQ